MNLEAEEGVCGIAFYVLFLIFFSLFRVNGQWEMGIGK